MQIGMRLAHFHQQDMASVLIDAVLSHKGHGHVHMVVASA